MNELKGRTANTVGLQSLLNILCITATKIIILVNFG